ncbi:nitrophenyl compound nitroreductase subunit ArsF family protein [Candidatus Hydrogenedentota bacterium]
MKTKTVVTGVLLLFVMGSLAYMGVKEFTASNDQDEVVEPFPIVIETPDISEDATTGGKSTVPTQAPSRSVVAYYFHGDYRCKTCVNLEGYAREALETNFADELKDGRLEWRVVNTDEVENEHFVTEYQLVTKSVVLVALEDGTEVEWRNLGNIWELVGEKPAYLEYIRTNTHEFLKANHD